MNIILTFVIEIIYTYSAYLLITVFQKKKSDVSKKLQFLSYAIFYIVIASSFIFVNNPYLTAALNIIGIFALSFLYGKNYIENARVLVAVFSILFIEDILFSYFGRTQLQNLSSYEEQFEILIIFIYNIFILISANYIKRLIKKAENRKSSLSVFMANFLISLISIAVSIILITNSEIKLNKFIIIETLLLIINFLSIFGNEQMLAFFNEHLKIEILKEKNNFYERELNLINETLKTERKYRHDEKKHILALQSFIENGDYEKASGYLKDMFEVIT